MSLGLTGCVGVVSGIASVVTTTIDVIDDVIFYNGDGVDPDYYDTNNEPKRDAREVEPRAPSEMN